MAQTPKMFSKCGSIYTTDIGDGAIYSEPTVKGFEAFGRFLLKRTSFMFSPPAGILWSEHMTHPRHRPAWCPRMLTLTLTHRSNHRSPASEPAVAPETAGACGDTGVVQR